MKRLFAFLVTLCLSMASAQTLIPFWHSQDATETLIQSFADEFNASQNAYKVVPQYTGSYQESAIKVAAALGGSNAPVLFDAEVTVFPRLAEEGGLADLSDLAAALPESLTSDFFPALWNYGVLDDERYGLPWNMSMPVLFYNASAFKQFGLEPPTTWDAFEKAAARLTTRNTRGYIDVAMAFIFETLVTTRGGMVVSDDGQPNFDSPEAVDALEMLQRLARERHSIPRGAGELDQALVDFARTKGMMALASEAFFPQGEKFSVAFEVASTPVPTGSSRAVPLMGSQLVVLKSASEEQRQGAFEFWTFLMQPEVQARWVEASYFLPMRRSVAASLQAWYDAEPNRRSALAQLEHAVYRPRIGAYVVWQGYLQEAQRRALESR
ncbi:MAG TPA: ABC transporter substrate-binding protein [Chloroflexota bacterium]|nr:ABC transporter substrate-binding protein [Chloroflexota bacterium]